MISLEQLPSIVIHQIISYLNYEDLLSLSKTSRYFQDRVSDQVIENLSLPKDFSDLSVNNRLRSRPVLNLAVIWTPLLNDLECTSLLEHFNLTKVGSLTVKILLDQDHDISWAGSGSR